MGRGFEAIRRGTIEMIVSSSSRDQPCLGAWRPADKGASEAPELTRALSMAPTEVRADESKDERIEDSSRLGAGGPASIASSDKVRSSSVAAAADAPAAAATRSKAVPWPAVAAGAAWTSIGICTAAAVPAAAAADIARNAGGAAAFDAEGRRTLGGGFGRAAGLRGEPPAAAAAAPFW